MRVLFWVLLAASISLARGEPTKAGDGSGAKGKVSSEEKGKVSSEEKGKASSDRSAFNYMYEYKKASAAFVDMWRIYNRLDLAVRHLLRDYNVAVKQQRYRELVQQLVNRQQQLEAMVEQHRMGELSRHVLRAELTSLKEMKQQLAFEYHQLERLPSEQHPEKLLELIELNEAPADLASALRSENSHLLRKSLKECSKLLEKLAKRQEEVTLHLKSLEYQANSPIHEMFVAQSAAMGNFFDPDAPLSIHMSVGKRM
ncbi:hypothetical protein TGGT1_237180 [Toxoplasma gondii GT1]|uniref:Uncharacterized protein n=3 Tax=Toxoplasma gondii TaxID=5811 RepID=S7UQY0_TOXGG|nr:hypothetical protein TGGT1_237180 [Toxoplasma gondii GT1]KAF4640153.1 hypothetical protein TGRH88_040780 [Toxoplasma gondii]KFH16309.1 hypothetical protein TGMAS_237180 [Toxoplasma gondii MAS]